MEIYGSPYKHPISRKSNLEKGTKDKKSLRVTFKGENQVKFF